MAKRAKYKKGMVGMFTPYDPQGDIFGPGRGRRTDDDRIVAPLEEAGVEFEDVPEIEIEGMELSGRAGGPIQAPDGELMEIEIESYPEIEIEDGGEQINAYVDLSNIVPQILAWRAEGMTTEQIRELCDKYTAENKDSTEPEKMSAVRECELMLYLLKIHSEDYWVNLERRGE